MSHRGESMHTAGNPVGQVNSCRPSPSPGPWSWPGPVWVRAEGWARPRPRPRLRQASAPLAEPPSPLPVPPSGPALPSCKLLAPAMPVDLTHTHTCLSACSLDLCQGWLRGSQLPMHGKAQSRATMMKQCVHTEGLMATAGCDSDMISPIG